MSSADWNLSTSAIVGDFDKVKSCIKLLLSYECDISSTVVYATKCAIINNHMEIANFLKLWSRNDQMAVFLREKLLEQHNQQQ